MGKKPSKSSQQKPSSTVTKNQYEQEVASIDLTDCSQIRTALDDSVKEVGKGARAGFHKASLDLLI
jgi:hypothetical protein